MKKNFGTLTITYNGKLIQETLHEIVTDGVEEVIDVHFDNLRELKQKLIDFANDGEV